MVALNLSPLIAMTILIANPAPANIIRQNLQLAGNPGEVFEGAGVLPIPGGPTTLIVAPPTPGVAPPPTKFEDWSDGRCDHNLHEDVRPALEDVLEYIQGNGSHSTDANTFIQNYKANQIFYCEKVHQLCAWTDRGNQDITTLKHAASFFNQSTRFFACGRVALDLKDVNNGALIIDYTSACYWESGHDKDTSCGVGAYPNGPHL